MANQDKITIWMNGKKTTMKHNDSRSLSQEEITRAEHAATMDKSSYHDDDTLKLPKIEESDERNLSSPKRSQHKWKPVIITIISAICMGSIFGMIMLKVVGTIGDYGNNEPSVNMISSNTNNEENNSTEGSDNQDASVYTLQEQKAYVVQGGVFEEEASVNDWKTSFLDAALSPVIWEQDGRNYLFVGIRQAKEQATAMATEIKETFGLDVFVKEWQTSRVELGLNQEEQKWVDSVLELWETSLENIGNETKLSVKDWEDLQNNSPKEADQLEAFIKKLTVLIGDLDNPSRKEGEAFLLQVWNAIETNLVS